MDWRDYEQLIREELESRYPNASVTWNAHVAGRYSGVIRQVDILVDAEVCDAPIRTIIDAKKYTERVDVKDVESFLSMMSDIGAHRGMIITNTGYTEAALMRAHRDPADVELDVLSLAELRDLQGEVAIPFAGDSGVLLPAPFGWVIDATQRDGAVATLYQRGRDLREAQEAREWAYVNFWRKDQSASSLEELLEMQNADFIAKDPSTAITALSGPARPDAKTAIRLAIVPGYPAPEYTGIVEFSTFMFFAVMFTPDELASRNLRKLREILRSAKPIGIRHV